MSNSSLDSTIESVIEASAMGGAAVAGGTVEDIDEEAEQLSEEDEIVEQKLRKYINKKIKAILEESNKKALHEEEQLRKVIRQLIKEGDVSDMHPHRSTGINTLEDLLKKIVPTLRTDYKRLTTDKMQRDSFRAHMLKAIKDSLMPSVINAVPPDGGGSMLLTPSEEEVTADEQEIEDIETSELSEELTALDELEINLDDSPDNKEKMIPVEDDDKPTDEEAFGIEGEDETGRNMAFATNKKIQQYILDAFDSLANSEDRKVFFDYLITNVKLYFDKFEDELQMTVEEPTTPEYEKAKGGGI